MARCAECQKRILHGGIRAGDAHLCGPACADKALIPAFHAALEAPGPTTTPIPLPSATRPGPDDSMLVDREGAKPVLVIAIGIAVALLLSLGLHVAESAIEWQLRGLSFWVVLPVGAVLNGMIISAGFFGAIRLLNVPPRASTYVAASLAAGALCWLTWIASYLTLTDETGTPVRDLLGFGEFMKLIIEESSISLGRSGGSAVTAGKWGYALFAADCVGFMIGAWATVRMAGAKPYCAKCGRFMARIGRVARSSADPTSAGTTLHAMQAHLRANDPSRALEALGGFGAPDEKAFFGIGIDCHGCPACKDYRAVVTTTLAGAKARRAFLTEEFQGNGDVRLG